MNIRILFNFANVSNSANLYIKLITQQITKPTRFDYQSFNTLEIFLRLFRDNHLEVCLTLYCL